MIEWPDGYTAPTPRGKLERFSRACMGGGGGSGAAIREQQLAREQSAKQFAEQMAFMRQQYTDAQNVKTPKYAPASPAPMASPDTYMQGIEQRRRQMSRFGSAATVLNSPLGGAVPIAA